jgi:hypothetical protein
MGEDNGLQFSKGHREVVPVEFPQFASPLEKPTVYEKFKVSNVDEVFRTGDNPGPS